MYEFGEFRLEPAERRLSTTCGEPVALEPKSYDVLLVLVRNAGRLVRKRELLDSVWREAFVEEGILAVHISALRRALGDSGRGWIQTVPRAGYRFAGLVTQRVAQPGTAWLSSLGVPPVRPEAYELIGRGRFHLLKASMFEVPKAVAAFRAAIEVDSTYAPAHAGLALACCAQAKLRIAPPADAYGEAKSSALRALAMDDACADAQAALAEVLFLSEWNWAGAERCLNRALRIDPHHSDACLLLGQLLEALGKLDEGLAIKLKALERDPFSPKVHLQVSMSYWNQRRYDRAIEWANKTLELDPAHPHVREHLAGVYWKQGDFENYLAENVRHAALHGVPESAFEPLRQAYAAGGSAGVRRIMLENASRRPQAFPAMQLALFYGEAGDMDQAFAHLERAIAMHDPGLIHLAVAPQRDALRGDMRFEECLRRMGLRTQV